MAMDGSTGVNMLTVAELLNWRVLTRVLVSRSPATRNPVARNMPAPCSAAMRKVSPLFEIILPEGFTAAGAVPPVRAKASAA